jgi:hypothetical protein
MRGVVLVDECPHPYRNTAASSKRKPTADPAPELIVVGFAELIEITEKSDSPQLEVQPVRAVSVTVAESCQSD